MVERPPTLHEPTSSWLRIRWPDEQPMPAIGSRMPIGLIGEDALALSGEVEVVDSRIDFEPGWCQVQVRAIT